ncbi:EscU/YscU/HrcU family type III secretion system export apparatus switch protein [Glacieibacterium megasporae]|uniref:EscU/YscU/HrcU family type III secretion system export apparatus switch protein n=1 Tax=Glacieibacterium megasporae TaxID=2835787 RepID=UPI001C1E1CE0|nr:EscU/YscU/HrcU family type III secretion system export apparatus switch protein [Polymorphobacter megasporae]UAJ09604.1 flagellar type III secretion system protein FlhB [Polymorphobacter megasporae]
MADAPDKDQKTEAPTEKRRREASKKGETLQSRELGTVLVIGAGVIWAIVAAGDLVAACRRMMRDGLSFADPGRTDLLASPSLLAQGMVHPLAVFAVLIVAGAAAGPMITAPHFSAGAFAVKLDRLNPIAGLQRVFGLHAVGELGKAVLKAALIFGAGGTVLVARLPGLLDLGTLDPADGAARIAASTSALLVALAVALGLIAAIDLPLQLTRHLAKLRMSKQEIREESRESEGSPETKAAQRRMARQAAKRSLAPAMATATVVVVNPTHFAVALRYVPGRDAAPIVVAKGRDVIAEAIRELAALNKVPILRYPQLTRAIYFTATVGVPINDELFGAVAAILAFVLYLDRSSREQPDVTIPDSLRFDGSGLRSLS